MNRTLPQYDIVLLGAGHTNAHVLRMWRMSPFPGVRLTCVTDFYQATYSGMLPGTLAGLYPPDRMQIDLARLCAAAGARLACAETIGLDVAGRQLLLAGRPPMPFDALSIGIGSVPRCPNLVERRPNLVENGVQIAGNAVLPIKPMQTFLSRLDERLAAVRNRVAGRPAPIAVVGGGAGGVEIAFCLPFHLREFWGQQPFELLLVESGPEILAGLPPGTAACARAELAARGVNLRLGSAVQSVASDRLLLADDRQEPIDLAIWATGAQAPAGLAALGLPTDPQGFLLTKPTLQSVGCDCVFAVGDAGSIQGRLTPKAGVYAVRQGPILWENLGRILRGEPLVEYTPQKGFLSLLATGDRRAILSYKGLTFHGGWCWQLKDYIDGRFMDKYQDYTPRGATHGQMASSEADTLPMRCAGCGGKVGGTVLGNVLKRLQVPPSEHVLLGLDTPDDAAIIRPPGGRPLVVTADFFTAFLDDPFLVGRVAALNAASDVFAMGSRPLAALALATVPVGPQRQQEQLLYELLAGGLEEFRRMGATLIGGHTIEGSEVTIGYTMLAGVGSSPPRTKAGLRAGDRLVLTKPLGSGILLAAHAQARCHGEWLERLLPVLLASNQAAAALADEFDIRGMTDITGFGLAGHLLEMLRASGLAAELRLADLPLLPGVEELVSAGLESTLAPANRAAEADIESNRQQQLTCAYAALFDPQTSGGLLLGVPERPHLPALLARLKSEHAAAPAVIGCALGRKDERALIHLT